MKSRLIFTALFISCLIAPSIYSNGAISSTVSGKVLDSSSSDGMAKVYQMTGSAVLTVKGSPIERNLKIGDLIEAGDSIYTRKGANISISFDRQRLNAVRVPADSKITFTRIEPTEIKVESGSVFNVVDGLAQGSTWKVVTPSTVAAVRGTVFMTTYVDGKFYAATLSVPDDGKSSAITVSSLDGQNNAMVFEGKEIEIKEGDLPAYAKVRELNPQSVLALQNFFKEVLETRQEPESDEGVVIPEAEFKETTCDSEGKNCSTKTCTKTANGDVCSYS